MFAKKGFIHEKHKQIQPFNRFFRPKFTLFRSFVPFTQIQMYETRKLLHRKTSFGRKPVKHGQTANLAHQCPTRTTVSDRTCRNLLFFHQHVLLTVSICLTFLPFFILVKLHGRLFHRKKWLETQICVQEEELQALSGDYSSFDDGKAYINPSHPYTFDLDVFGHHSLFQAMNRTCTIFGKDCLAHWLQHHLCEPAAIRARQQMVQDLSQRPLFREQFRVTGLVHQGTASDGEKLRAWSQSPSQYLHAGWVKAFTRGVPLINGLLLITSLAGWTSFTWLGLSFGLFLILSFGIVKRATYVQETYGKQLKSLNGYAQLIALAKKEQWEAPALQQLMNRLDMDGKSPVDALQQLSNELDRLDLRNNQFLYVLLEGSLFFQLQEIVRIERWKARYGQHITGWLEAIGELDALCSLGTFAYNHPAYTYPELAEKSFCFLATRMGHPLMPPAQCVKTTPLSRRAPSSSSSPVPTWLERAPTYVLSE